MDSGIRRVACAGTAATHVAAASRDVRETIISPHVGDQPLSTAGCTACRGTSIRACCSIAPICCAKPVSTRLRATGRNGGADGCDPRAQRRQALGRFAADQRIRPVAGIGPAATRTACCATAAATAISRAPDSSARSRFTSTCSGAATCRPITNIQVGNPWEEFGRGAFVFYLSGPWNIGEFRKRLPATQQDDWSTAPLPGPDGPGDSVAYGSSLVISGASHAQARCVAADRIPLAPAGAAAFLRIAGRPAAASLGVGRPRR